MEYIPLYLWITHNKLLTVLLTHLLFFNLAQLHVSVVFDHHRAINAVLQSKAKNTNIYILWDPTGLQKYCSIQLYKIAIRNKHTHRNRVNRYYVCIL